jgi:hypothetical protein
LSYLLGARHLAPVYEQVLYLPTSSSTSDVTCLGLNPYVGSYYLTVMTSQGIPIGVNISQPTVGATSSSSSGATPDLDSTEDYPETGGNSCWDPAVEGRLIIILALALLGTVSAGTPPSKDQKRPMLEHLMIDWFII